MTCEQVGGPSGAETRVVVEILTPAPGEIVAPTAACGQPLTLTGTFIVSGPPVLHDIYIVIDRSGSASADSGADVDGDGVFGEAEDSIYDAELAAAQAFVRALSPAVARVAVIAFNRDAVLEHQLSADLASVDARLEALKAARPRWGTGYVPAMQAVLDEVALRGDPANRVQRVVFLSDGVPDESLAEIHAKALELTAADVIVDTFALGAINSVALEDIAATTGGRFTAVATPGDVLTALPSFVPTAAVSFDARNETDGSAGTVLPDDTTGTFEATVWLAPGDNHVVLELTADTGGLEVTVTCAIDVTLPQALVADAGLDLASCEDEPLLLSGVASTFGPCAQPTWRWLDCAGSEVGLAQDLALPSCGACVSYTLEVSCAGEPCIAVDVVAVECLKRPTLAPVARDECALSATLDCGASEPGLVPWWDLDLALDSDGNGDPEDDLDLSGCVVDVRWGDPGLHQVLVSAVGADGCRASSRLSVVVPPSPPIRRLDGGTCPGDVDLASGAGPGATCWWDLDSAVDFDLDGDPTNDADAFGCDVTLPWTQDGVHDVVAWAEDPSGCRAILAAGRIVVSGSARPGEAGDLRLSRVADALTLTWAPVPGAVGHAVSRGTLDALWSRRTYDHAADPLAGQGECSVAGVALVDPDDAAPGEDAYYLVTALNDCAGEGPAGHAWNGQALIPRPPRTPTASCP